MMTDVHRRILKIFSEAPKYCIGWYELRNRFLAEFSTYPAQELEQLIVMKMIRRDVDKRVAKKYRTGYVCSTADAIVYRLDHKGFEEVNGEQVVTGKIAKPGRDDSSTATPDGLNEEQSLLFTRWKMFKESAGESAPKTANEVIRWFYENDRQSTYWQAEEIAKLSGFSVNSVHKSQAWKDRRKYQKDYQPDTNY